MVALALSCSSTGSACRVWQHCLCICDRPRASKRTFWTFVCFRSEMLPTGLSGCLPLFVTSAGPQRRQLFTLRRSATAVQDATAGWQRRSITCVRAWQLDRTEMWRTEAGRNHSTVQTQWTIFPIRTLRMYTWVRSNSGRQLPGVG